MSEVSSAPEATKDQTPAETAGNAVQSPAAAEAKKVGGPTKLKFHFKSRTETQKVKDEAGNDVEKDVKLPKPEPVELTVPLMTVTDLQNVLIKNDEKEVALVLEAVNGIIISQARSLVDEDVEKSRKEGVDQEQLTWNFIANIPPATRRGGGIADEVWDAFVEDYTEVMQHHGKTKEKAATGAKLLAKRFNPVKDQKKIIKALQENLMVWYANTAKADEFTEVYETLTSKADTLLAKDEDALMQAI